REKQLRTAHARNVTKEVNKWNDTDFLTNQIRDQQDDDEDMDKQIVKAKTAQPRIARDQPANHDVDLNCSNRPVACIFAVAARHGCLYTRKTILRRRSNPFLSL